MVMNKLVNTVTFESNGLFRRQSTGMITNIFFVHFP
jgi:hypothetical protein